jgi:hypothetical protein
VNPHPPDDRCLRGQAKEPFGEIDASSAKVEANVEHG